MAEERRPGQPWKPLPRGAPPKPGDVKYLHAGDVVLVHVPRSHTKGSEQYSDTPRPWVIISENSGHQSSRGLFVALPLTTQDHADEYPAARIRIAVTEQHSDHSDFQPENCVALTEQVRTASIDRMNPLVAVGRMSPRAMDAIRAGVKHVAGLNDRAARLLGETRLKIAVLEAEAEQLRAEVDRLQADCSSVRAELERVKVATPEIEKAKGAPDGAARLSMSVDGDTQAT